MRLLVKGCKRKGVVIGGLIGDLALAPRAWNLGSFWTHGRVIANTKHSF